jgi:Flp pilus assembly protein TadG
MAITLLARPARIPISTVFRDNEDSQAVPMRIRRSSLLVRIRNERGVSLVIVAVQILVLTAMCTFVLDYGMVWSGRRQAQNAADAGALAAAIALEKDDRTWPAIAAVVTNSGNFTARANKVIGQTPGTVVTAVCPPWLVAPNNVNCVQVDVYRDGTNGSTAMPVFFGRLIGQTSQKVKATATAQVVAANTSGCMRPWFITDWYNDVNMDNMYDAGDIYTFPGYSIDNAPPNPAPGIGAAVVFHGDGGPSSYGQLDVGAGGADIRAAIQHCDETPQFTIGTPTDPCPSTSCVATKPGNNVGQERAGIRDLLSWDPDAGGVHWDPAKKEVVGGCSAAGTCNCTTNQWTGPCPYGGTQSPRIVQAAICAPSEAQCNGTVPGNGYVHILNMLSFFITGCNGQVGTCTGGGSTMDINAILIGSAGLLTGPTPGPGSSFVTITMLVR